MSGGVQVALAASALIAAVTLALSFRQETPTPEAGSAQTPEDAMGQFEREFADGPSGPSGDADPLAGDGRPGSGAGEPSCACS